MKKIVVISLLAPVMIFSRDVNLHVNVYNQLTSSPTINQPIPRTISTKTNSSSWHMGSKKSYFLTATAIGTLSYTCVASLLYYYSFKVARLNWIHWKERIAVSHLEQEDKQTLQAQLLDDMFSKYGNDPSLELPENVYTFFTERIQEELDYCTKLQTLHERIKLFRVTRLFPFGKKQVGSVSHYIRRLVFIKSLLAVNESF